jgi:hypothetical protein
MGQEILQSANRIVVPDRAGQLIVQRRSWPVTVKSNGDTVVVGYLPAGCRPHAPACQLIVEAAVANSNWDLCLVDTSTILIDGQAHTTATLTRAAVTTYSTIETIGVSSSNRAIVLLLNTAPASAAGTVHVDLAYYAP